MAKPWIEAAVIEKGKEGLRWLSSIRNGSGGSMQGADEWADGYTVNFSEHDGVLSVGMKYTKNKKGKAYLLQVLQVSLGRIERVGNLADGHLSGQRQTPKHYLGWRWQHENWSSLRQ